MAEVEDVPSVYYAPVVALRWVVGERAWGCGERGGEFADCCRCGRDLGGAEVDVPVYVVFEDEDGFQICAQEPAQRVKVTEPREC